MGRSHAPPARTPGTSASALGDGLTLAEIDDEGEGDADGLTDALGLLLRLADGLTLLLGLALTEAEGELLADEDGLADPAPPTS